MVTRLTFFDHEHANTATFRSVTNQLLSTRFAMHWSSPFSSIYGNLPDVFSPKSGQHDKENFANRSCTFGENPSTKIEKECSVSKPATPTSLPIVPRRKVSTPLRVRQAPQSDEEDEKFDYLAKRPFPTDARSSIPDVILLPGVEVRDKVL